MKEIIPVIKMSEFVFFIYLYVNELTYYSHGNEMLADFITPHNGGSGLLQKAPGCSRVLAIHNLQESRLERKKFFATP